MTLNVGVIGVGMIGQDHIRRLTHVLSGARVSAVSDVDLERAKSVAEGLPGGVQTHATGRDLIVDDGVDAVIVASWGPTHEEYVLASIEAGKPVFCEKPLATTREACERIVDAEVAAGKRLVMVGFMRRYDAGYRAMKETITSGEIGAPLVFHSAHRNPSVPPSVTSEMVVVDTCVHDIDVSRFLLDAEVAAVRVLGPRRSGRAAAHLQDPMVVLLEMTNGALVDVEASINVAYGYDIRGEVLGESGAVELAESNTVVVKREGRFGGRVPTDWRERFITAYDAELQEWINAATVGSSTGPSSWDGYAATVVCDAGVEALRSGDRVEVTLRDQPDLYTSGVAASGGGGTTGTD
jgi:myo-inositol 2-dehydrogenase/D-chiro-inositol 1-dehydrogenase